MQNVIESNEVIYCYILKYDKNDVNMSIDYYKKNEQKIPKIVNKTV